jgi:DNA-directed RNA polymerase III subunit RPC2
MTGGGR